MKLLNELLTIIQEKDLLGNKSQLRGKHSRIDPKYEGSYLCQYRNIDSLRGGPKTTTKDYDCSNNVLTSLEWGPTSVGGDFKCDNNKLTSLELCPKEIGGLFSCKENKLTSLKDIHKQLTKMSGEFNAGDNPITSHVLCILNIEGCSDLVIDNDEVEAIINKYLPNKEGRKGLMKCKAELVDAGFDEYAQL